MLCIIQRSIFYGKFIHYKQEEGIFCVMLTKDGHIFAWVVSVWCQVLDELLVCDDSGLIESIHAFDNLNVDKSLVFNDENKAVLIADFLVIDRDV